MGNRLRNAVLLVATASLGQACVAAPAANRPLAEVPYRLDGKLLLVAVQVNGVPTTFMVDSGASHSVLDPRLTSALGLRTVHTSATTGTGAGAIPVGHVGPVRLAVGPLTVSIPDPWVIDLSGVPISNEVRGLIGAELFKRYVVRIDPRRRTLAVFDPARFSAPRRARSIPLWVEGDKLFTEATLEVRPGLTVVRRLRIDTGSEESVNDPIVCQARETRVTTLGNGLGANYQSCSGLLDGLRIGPYRIARVWGPGGTGPAIGMEIFRRFTTTFDATRGRIYLEPTPALAEPVPPPPAQ